MGNGRGFAHAACPMATGTAAGLKSIRRKTRGPLPVTRAVSVSPAELAAVLPGNKGFS